MESTAYSETTLSEVFERLNVPRSKICRGPLWADPAISPPILEDMMPDLERVIASTAQRYCDTTTPHLHFDELVGEGRLKLAELISKGELERQPFRTNFFKFFAAAVNNAARSRVQKYRFTEKRTGQRPPPKHLRFQPPQKPVDEDDENHTPEPEYRKNVEISLDDPDQHVQVAQTDNGSESSTAQIEEEFEALLNPIEVLVFRQLHRVNAASWCYAMEDAYRRKSNEKLHVRIRNEHLAAGIGISAELFEQTVLTVREKITRYRKMTPQEHDEVARRNAIIATLSQLFGLQIPPGLDDMVIRRLFTMASIDQYDEKVKGKPDVEEMLLQIGAKPIRMLGNRMSCYGILFARNCRKCNVCDLRQACSAEAANIGLTTMSISPRLLGHKGVRVPTCLPKTGSVDSRISTAEEAEILTHLNDTFKQLERDGSVTYYHVVGVNKRKRLLFSVRKTSPLVVQFINPSDALKDRLVGGPKSWQPDESADLADIIDMIEQHAKETFE